MLKSERFISQVRKCLTHWILPSLLQRFRRVGSQTGFRRPKMHFPVTEKPMAKTRNPPEEGLGGVFDFP
jgi:hypothetical protein